MTRVAAFNLLLAGALAACTDGPPVATDELPGDALSGRIGTPSAPPSWGPAPTDATPGAVDAGADALDVPAGSDAASDAQAPDASGPAPVPDAASPGDSGPLADAPPPTEDAAPPPPEPPPPRGPGPCTSPEAGAGWMSERVRCNAAGDLEYPADRAGNRICDFSHAGYRGGGVPLPDLPEVERVGPVAGDATAAIQAALDRVAARAPDAEGHRGAVVLAAGRYEIRGTLVVGASGVVLRGSGRGSDAAANTVLVATGNRPAARAVIRLGGGVDDGFGDEQAGTRTEVTTPLVPVCDRRLEVAEPAHFSVGDDVVVEHPSTEAWLDAVGHGETHGEGAWTPGSKDLRFRRRIVAIEGATLVLDAPVFNTLDARLSRSTVYRPSARMEAELGVERLRVDIEAGEIPDEDHAATGIELVGVRDAWVREVTVLHYATEGVVIRSGVRVTVQDARVLDPVSPIDGGYMYALKTDAAQLSLFTDCEARNARHSYVANGTTRDNGIVFHRSLARGSRGPSEGHHRWSMGLLYDLHREEDRRADTDVLLGLYNRGDYGTGHGWSTANSVAWNVDLAGGTGIIQRPPTAQNYAVGGAGEFTGSAPPAPFDHPEGHIEGVGRPGLFPASLYEAQLAERLR